MSGPTRARRRPLTAEVFQFTGDNGAQIADWAGIAATFEGGRLVIHTPQGDMTPNPGEYVIHGLVDEYYPITAEAFFAGWEVMA